MTRWFLFACALAAWISTSGDAPADDANAQAPVSFRKDVRPLLRKHCQGCHQPAKADGKYDLTTYDALLKAGRSNLAAVVPGNVEDSHLLDLITPFNGKAEMPKDRPPLAEAEVDLIERWIAEGAANDAPERDGPAIDMEHPPAYPALPVVTSADFSPDGQLLAVSGYHEVILHKGDGSEIVSRLVGLSERIESAKFSPDGKRLAVTGGSPGRMGEVQIWNVEERKLLISVPVTFDTVYGASWSKDGKLVAFGCGDNTVRAIDAETGKQVLYQGAHNDWVLDTVFSTDSSHLVSVSRDMSMKLIEVATERFVDNITSITPGALKGGLITVDRHPTKDEVVVGGADGTPKLFRMYRQADQARRIGDDFNLIRNYDPLPGRVYGVCFNADGSRFAVGSSLDGAGEARVYDTETGSQVSRREVPSGGVYAVDISPDGTVLAVGGFDGVIRLLKTDNGELIKEFPSVPVAPPQVAALLEN
jgi:WD40 repeat protein/mono/diheme cytochrome c family protein